jgi:hypothetical protein
MSARSATFITRIAVALSDIFMTDSAAKIIRSVKELGKNHGASQLPKMGAIDVGETDPVETYPVAELKLGMCGHLRCATIKPLTSLTMNRPILLVILISGGIRKYSTRATPGIASYSAT